MDISAPKIVINGVALHGSQILTIHVALQTLEIKLGPANPLGKDPRGEKLRLKYLKSIAELTDLMWPAIPLKDAQ